MLLVLLFAVGVSSLSLHPMDETSQIDESNQDSVPLITAMVDHMKDILNYMDAIQEETVKQGCQTSKMLMQEDDPGHYNESLRIFCARSLRNKFYSCKSLCGDISTLGGRIACNSDNHIRYLRRCFAGDSTMDCPAAVATGDLVTKISQVAMETAGVAISVELRAQAFVDITIRMVQAQTISQGRHQNIEGEANTEGTRLNVPLRDASNVVVKAKDVATRAATASVLRQAKANAVLAAATATSDAADLVGALQDIFRNSPYIETKARADYAEGMARAALAAAKRARVQAQAAVGNISSNHLKNFQEN